MRLGALHAAFPDAQTPSVCCYVLWVVLPVTTAVPGNGLDNSDVILSLSKAVSAAVGKPEQVDLAVAAVDAHTHLRQ